MVATNPVQLTMTVLSLILRLIQSLLRINASYYGWKMALYILALMLVGIVTVSLLMHYSLALLGMLPDFSGQTSMGEREFFKWNYQAVLNILFLTATAILLWFWRQGQKQHSHDHHHHDHDHGGSSLTDKVLSVLVVVALLWLAGGVVVPPF